MYGFLYGWVQKSFGHPGYMNFNVLAKSDKLCHQLSSFSNLFSLFILFSLFSLFSLRNPLIYPIQQKQKSAHRQNTTNLCEKSYLKDGRGERFFSRCIPCKYLKRSTNIKYPLQPPPPCPPTLLNQLIINFTDWLDQTAPLPLFPPSHIQGKMGGGHFRKKGFHG